MARAGSSLCYANFRSECAANYPGALRKGAERLAQLELAGDAPPAFFLDANRQGDGRKMMPDEFDDRSISFTTDFPSAN